jgi:hypothetical protein
MTTWQDRLRDARRFWEVAEAALDPEHVNQAASNAILAVIAANDAVCLHLGEGKPAGRSHTEAATMLQEVCRGTMREADAARRSRQLVDILRLKTAVQYESRVLRADELKRLMSQARRFIEWAQTILPPPTG